MVDPPGIVIPDLRGNASRKVMAFMLRVQMSSESAELKIPW
jgi:hypothetical protein